MTEKIAARSTDRQNVDGADRGCPAPADQGTLHAGPSAIVGQTISISGDTHEGAVTVIPDGSQNSSSEHSSDQELEGLVHLLIYRIDLLLACLKLADWGDQDFTSTIEETEAILSEGALYNIGRKMAHLFRAYESVAMAAMASAQFSMLVPGYVESTRQLEEALALLSDIRRGLPLPGREDDNNL